MYDYEIFTDSSSDLGIAMIEKYSLHVLQLDVTVEDKEPMPNDKVDIKELYSELRAKKSAKTNAVNVASFKEEMEKTLKDGKDIIYIGFSSGLSATYASGKLAADELREAYPDRKILYTDTLCASLGEGLIVIYCAKMRENGASVEEVYQFAEEHKLNFCHEFTVDDLFFLKRGGRINAATAIVGTMLGVKPVLHVDNEGKLVNIGKARGRKASIVAMYDRLKANILPDKCDDIFISHGDCIDDANMLADMIKADFPDKEIYIDYVGPVIGSHSGPGTLALFYYGEKR